MVVIGLELEQTDAALDQGRAVARIAEVNGEPGAVLRNRDGRLLGVIALEIAGDQIVAIRSVVNPDKLGHLGPLGDMYEVLGQRP